MAGDWIKVEKNTPDKPEVLLIASILGIDDPDTVVGKLVRVWSWFDSNSVNGHAPKVTNVLIDRLTGHAGFLEAMEKAGWSGETEEGFFIPNFDRHLGKNAKKRAQDAERKRKQREREQEELENSSEECHDNSVTENGLEKRREEKNNSNNNTVETDDDSAQKTLNDQVFDIFQYWKDIMKKGAGTKLTKERRGKIVDRLNDKYSVDDIKQAIWNCSQSPHNMGKNDRNTTYNDIELICRNATKLEYFRDNVGNGHGEEYKTGSGASKHEEVLNELYDNED